MILKRKDGILSAKQNKQAKGEGETAWMVKEGPKQACNCVVVLSTFLYEIILRITDHSISELQVCNILQSLAGLACDMTCLIANDDSPEPS